MMPTAILNPKTKKLAVSKEEIKQVTLQYCKETLENNPPAKEAVRSAEIKDALYESRLQAIDGDFMADKDLLAKVIHKFKYSKKKSYDFLVKSGPKFKDSCLKLCQRMFREEVFPDSYKDTVLNMVYKGKGNKEQLQNNRFVHCKLWQPRLAEALLVEGGMKEPLVSCSSRYQVGGQAGHRPEELLFVFKSVLARYRSLKRVVVGQCHDVSKFFDKEVAPDTLDTMYRRGVDPKICRLWAKMNDTTLCD